MMCSASVMMWSSQLETSCANIDRRDGGSVGSGGGTCAWTSAKPDSKKNKEKLAVLVTFCFIIFAPRTAQPNGAPPIYSELGRCFGTHRAKLRYVFLPPTGGCYR